MVARGIKASVSFGDSSLPQLNLTPPVVLPPVSSLTGSSREWVAQDLTTDASVASWADRRGGAPLINAGGAAQPVVMVDGTKRFVRFDGVDDILEDATATFSQPHTKVVRFRFQGTRKASEPIWSSSGTASGVQSNVFINTGMTQYVNFAGTVLATTAGGINTSWHTLIAVVNGATSVTSIDGVEVTGAAGSNTGLSGIRLGKGAASSTVFATIDIQRVALLPHAADATERAAIIAAAAA